MELRKEYAALQERSAGILMHLTSLPGPAYIGDLGPAATSFADFLRESGQRIWQMLPIQPTGPDQSYSPYSASSAMAGNPLLISPQQLVNDRLIKVGDLQTGSRSSEKVNYDKALAYKQRLLEKAWKKWSETSARTEKIAFTDYCAKEHYWLEDFALYSLLKNLHKGAAWYQWPPEFRNREEAALDKIRRKYKEELNGIKWIQMVFERQWTAFHKLCESLQVKLIGDVPIYVAHDSADVWSHREIFTVDENGQLSEVAGVPPDLFNSNGQLWGMPLYNWQTVREKGYSWWVQRLRKNLEWFDLIRLDHFRGFSSYWSVPAGAATAKEGSWVPGPGSDFFSAIKEELGRLPFVAEDLGEIDSAVYLLRDEFDLPGMNVLQFAFGDDMPNSPYLPHHHIRNSVVYTGTHDNNTTRGWFSDLGKIEKKNLSAYTGAKLNSGNAAEHLIRLAYMSVSDLAVIPMQDILNLDAKARMNMPATSRGNWQWRLRKSQLTDAVKAKLKEWTFFYKR